jgi:anti-anti-sigma factor
MQITDRLENQTRIVAIAGNVDALTAGEVTQYLSGRINAEMKQIILDLSQVDFMSSAGLRMILTALKASRYEGGDLYLAGTQPSVEKMLKVSGFTSILKTFPSVEAASVEFSSQDHRAAQSNESK